MGYMIESEGKNLFLGGDFANHYIWSLAYPEWELRFDRDREGPYNTAAYLGHVGDEKCHSSDTTCHGLVRIC